MALNQETIKPSIHIMILTIDQRLSNDLNDILQQGSIQSVHLLNNHFNSFTPKCIPGYFWGDRNANIVFVNLNPGGNPEEYCSARRFELERLYWKNNLHGFINFIKDQSVNFGKIDYNNISYFDIKQAAFLDSWKNSGIDKVHGLNYGSINDNNKDEKDKKFKEAKKNVLMQRLQLELLPYPSKSFPDIKGDYSIFYPYLETILEEIFAKNRKYVIFASRVFYDLFLKYDKNHNVFKISLYDRLELEYDFTKKRGDKSSITFSCTPLKIKYEDKEQIAIIAHTFPHQALSKAFGLMQQYGQFCYYVYTYFVQNGTCPTNNELNKWKQSKATNIIP